MIGRLASLVKGEELEEARKNMAILIEGTNKLISELKRTQTTMRELAKALKGEAVVLKELKETLE